MHLISMFTWNGLFTTTPSGLNKIKSLRRNFRTSNFPVSNSIGISSFEHWNWVKNHNKPLREVLSCDLYLVKLLLHRVAAPTTSSVLCFCTILPFTNSKNRRWLSSKQFQFHSFFFFSSFSVHLWLWQLIRISPDNRTMWKCFLINVAFECTTTITKPLLIVNHLPEIFFSSTDIDTQFTQFSMISRTLIEHVGFWLHLDTAQIYYVTI